MRDLGFPVPDDAAADADRLVKHLQQRGATAREYGQWLYDFIVGGEWTPALVGVERVLYYRSVEWLWAALSPPEQFMASAVSAGAAFDTLVNTGQLTREELGAYLRELFRAIYERQTPPILRDDMADPTQWMCDLFVDSANRDEAYLLLVPMNVELLEAGKQTAAGLAVFMARRVVTP